MKREMLLKEQLLGISIDLFGEDCTYHNNPDENVDLKHKSTISKKANKVVCKREDVDPNEIQVYSLLFTGEDYCTAHVKMTRAEAMIVNRVLQDADKQVKGYCGRVYLDMDSENISENFMRKITSSELLALPFGSKIKVIWHNSKHHEKNEEYVGMIFGQKIGWEDGLEDDVRTIAECVYNDWCMVYLMND